MTMSTATGFLVVLTRADGVTEKNPSYMGVNRIPDVTVELGTTDRSHKIVGIRS